MRKVCLVGFSYTSRDLAPFEDSSWEFWGCNGLATVIDYFDGWSRWWDMHDMDDINAIEANRPGYKKWLAELKVPVYMLEHHEEFPTSVAYPLEEIQKEMLDWGFPPDGVNYFESTIAYQIALALHEGVDELAIYGVDMVKDSEYEYQKPNLEAWVTLARSRGVPVHIPKESALMSSPAGGLYGYKTYFGTLPKLAHKTFRERMEAHVRDCDQARREWEAAAAKFHTHDGARQECEWWIDRMMDIERGSKG